MKEYILLLIVLACSTEYAHGLSCLPCEAVNCTKPNCEKSGYAYGICGCCEVCAKAVNESCRGIWNTLGTCDRNLTCNSTVDQLTFDSTFSEGVCSDAECKAIVDVMLAIDGSRSQSESNFTSMKKWLTEAMALFYQRYGACVHIGALVYATDFPENFFSPFGLGECTNNQDCYGGRLTNNVTLLDVDDPYTYRALHTIVEDYFPKSARYDRSRKVIVVVTDEPPLWGPTDRQSWRNVSDENEIDTYVVALSFPPAAPFDWSEVISGNGRSWDTFLPIANTTTQELVQSIWDATVKEAESCEYPTKYTPCKSTSCAPTCAEPFAICPLQCDEPGCVCDEGYVRLSESNDTCVRYDDCPQRQCVYPEIYKECSSVCDATCDNLDPICVTVCGEPRCECADGYVWRSDEDHTCIPRSSCPNECPDGQPIMCIAYACDFKKCPAYPDAECRGRCNGCIADFFDQFGNNVTDKCNQCTFPEVYRECSSPCNGTCANPYPVCIERCDPPKCECADGYVRASAENSTCIPLDQCQAITCEYPKVYQECAPSCQATCDNPNPICPTVCGIAYAHCVCPVDHVLYSETDRRCVHAYECPGRSCRRECPEIDLTRSNGCSQQLYADAWICQLSNWKCTTYEWKLSMEEWWYNESYYTATGEIEERWRQLFTCEQFPLTECTDHDAYRYEIDAFGCGISYCARGGYKDVTQPLQMWQTLFAKYQKLMQIYKEASQLRSGN